MVERLGTLEPGKLADVTIVSGRPDETLQDLAKVVMVMRDGYVQVEQGRLFIPHHEPIALPQSRPR